MTKWYYKGISLRKYCKDCNLNYNNLRQRLINVNNVDEEVLFNLIKEQQHKRINDDIKRTLNLVINDESITVYKEYTNILNINYNHVNYLYYKGYSRKEIIIFSWFYYDKLNNKGEKILSLKKLKLLKSINYLKDNDNLLDIVVFSILKNKEALNKLYDKVKPYLKSIIKTQMKSLKISYSIDILMIL